MAPDRFEVLKGDYVGHEFHGNQWTRMSATGHHDTAVESIRDLAEIRSSFRSSRWPLAHGFGTDGAAAALAMDAVDHFTTAQAKLAALRTEIDGLKADYKQKVGRDWSPDDRYNLAGTNLRELFDDIYNKEKSYSNINRTQDTTGLKRGVLWAWNRAPGINAAELTKFAVSNLNRAYGEMTGSTKTIIDKNLKPRPEPLRAVQEKVDAAQARFDAAMKVVNDESASWEDKAKMVVDAIAAAKESADGHFYLSQIYRLAGDRTNQAAEEAKVASTMMMHTGDGDAKPYSPRKYARENKLELWSMQSLGGTPKSVLEGILKEGAKSMMKSAGDQYPASELEKDLGDAEGRARAVEGLKRVDESLARVYPIVETAHKLSSRYGSLTESDQFQRLKSMRFTGDAISRSLQEGDPSELVDRVKTAVASGNPQDVIAAAAAVVVASTGVGDLKTVMKENAESASELAKEGNPWLKDVIKSGEGYVERRGAPLLEARKDAGESLMSTYGDVAAALENAVKKQDLDALMKSAPELRSMSDLLEAATDCYRDTSAPSWREDKPEPEMPGAAAALDLIKKSEDYVKSISPVVNAVPEIDKASTLVASMSGSSFDPQADIKDPGTWYGKGREALEAYESAIEGIKPGYVSRYLTSSFGSGKLGTLNLYKEMAVRLQDKVLVERAALASEMAQAMVSSTLKDLPEKIADAEKSETPRTAWKALGDSLKEARLVASEAVTYYRNLWSESNKDTWSDWPSEGQSAFWGESFDREGSWDLRPGDNETERRRTFDTLNALLTKSKSTNDDVRRVETALKKFERENRYAL